MQNTPNISARQVVYQDRYQEIYKVTADFGEFQKEYFVREAGHKAGMVAVKDDAILLVKQYRFLINGLSWEIPGGRVDDGETPEEAAIRECFEESGILLACDASGALITVEHDALGHRDAVLGNLWRTPTLVEHRIPTSWT